MAEVTIFIEDSAIKLLMTKGRRVGKWAKLLLEPGLVSDGVILDEDRVADKLKELFKLQGVGAKKVIAGLSGFNSVYRLVSLPELPEAVLPEAVRREARRVIPVPLELVYLSYQSIPAPAGEKRVFLVAFPRNTTDTLIRTLHKAGLEPRIMDLAPLALCRTIDEPRAIVVDVQSASLDIAVMTDRVPQIIRSLSLPSEAQSLSERLPTIVEEINRTIAFYNSSHQEQPLDSSVPVFVSGDLAEAPDTWQSLVGTSGHSVSALPSPVQSPEGFDPSQFMVNIGLALKQLQPERKMANLSLVNFNALPEVYQPKGIHLLNILVPVSAVVGIGLLIYAGFFVQSTSAHTIALRSQLPPIENRIAEQQQAIAAAKEEIKQIEPQIEPLEATANIFGGTLTKLGEERTRVNGDLSSIVGLVPADIALIYGGDRVILDEPLDEAKIIHSVEQVIINGIARDEAEIFKYARDLRESGRYSMVIISSIEAFEETEKAEEEEEEEEVEEEVEFKGFNFELLLVSETGE